MKILVINCGSSSIKYQLFDMEREELLAKGMVEKIGEKYSVFHQETKKRKIKKTVKVSDHSQGLQLIIKFLLSRSYGIIKNFSEISAVGHRVVHGGSKFIKSTLITEDVIQTVEKYVVFAPLHNPPNLAGIEAAMSALPDVPHVAVFDTAFHQTMPEEAYIYPIPYEYYKKYGIRRYGFHGTSHQYVAQEAAKALGKDIRDLKIITCHLGAGCSMAALKSGKSVDTSMGFTPLEGLPMGTRSGDIDPSIIIFIAEKEGLGFQDVNEILNKKSGLLGISGVSNDVREITESAKGGNHRAKLALNVFAYRVRKYIGAYAAVLGGVDALVFTGGIGEKSADLRSKICDGLDFLGIKLDEKKNKNPGKWAGAINRDDSPAKILVIPTWEELMIARETFEIVQKLGEAHSFKSGRAISGRRI
jgi:acetate kinase